MEESESDKKKPTLLRKNFIKPPDTASVKEINIIKNTISVDYIINQLTNKLPVTAHSYIKDTPRYFGDKVIVIKADTGSGKSTVLPVKLYEAFFPRTQKNIIITQPRVLTAKENPKEMVKYYKNLKLGQNIGYNTGPLKLPPNEKGILFCTVGILTEELIAKTDEEFMQKYQFVIIDEVHDRDINIDRCLFLMKKLLIANYTSPECPLLLLMSATFDESIFMRYFEVPAQNYMQVIGKTFPIASNFPAYSVSNYIKYASIKSQEIHLSNLDELDPSSAGNSLYRDIIIFVTDKGVGKKIYDELHIFNSGVLTQPLDIIMKYKDKISNDIENLYKKLGGAVDKSKRKDEPNYHILPIVLDTVNFSAGGLEYQNLFSKLEVLNTPIWELNEFGGIDMNTEPIKYVTPTRRIIIATNVAETGITIETLKYCLDTGYQRSAEFYPDYNCASLISKNISYGSAIQRKGRVGRKSPGNFYTCYTADTFNALPKDKLASILTSDTTQTLLTLLIKEKNVEILPETSINKIENNKMENIFQKHRDVDNSWYYTKNETSTNISAIDFIELPSIQSLSHSVEQLHILGFIDNNYDVTTLGFYANKFKMIGLESIKLIMSGYCYGANILDLITIVSFINITKRRIFGKNFILENFMKLNDTEFAFYNQILIADDFINCIFIWNMLQKYINKNIDHNGGLKIEKITEWCIENNILFDGLVKLIDIRDGIIDNMINIGLNPYYNSLGLIKNEYNLNNILINSLHDGLIEVKKIKQSIYEGYKLQTLVHSELRYISLFKNIPVRVKSAVVIPLDENLVEQVYPKYIVCDSYMLSQKFGKPFYEFAAEGFISVMDNFVDIDLKFFLH